MKRKGGTRLMQELLGLSMILAGFGIGLYVGVWLCSIGGAVDIAEFFKSSDYPARQFAIGILKIVGAVLAGSISSLVLILPGHFILNKV